MEPQTQNGKSRFSFPTFGCEGCESRKAIMGAGNWKVDAAILAVIVAFIVVMWKVKIA
jgi:hypothetical protein